jgi:hypothetical protein
MFILLAAVAVADAQAPPLTLEAAQRGWEEIERSTNRYRGVVLETCEALSGLPPSESWKTRQEFAFSGENVLYKFAIVDFDGPEVPEEVMAINPDYAFEIKKQSDNQEWQIRHAGGKERVERLLLNTAQPLYISTIVDMEPLPWLTTQPGFKLKRISDASAGDEQLAVMEFESTAVFRPDWRITGGTVTLDVGRHWAVRDYRVNIQTNPPCVVTGSVEYDPSNKTLPIPVRAVKDQKFPNDGIHRHFTIDYESFEEAETPESAFRLTAYGLPEPSGERRLWQLVLLGGLVLAAAAALIYIARKRSSA